MANKIAIPGEPLRISLQSKGLTMASGFFIVLSLTFILFLSYAIFAFARLADFSNFNSYYAMSAIVVVMLFSVIMFLTSYSLTYESQEVSLSVDEIVIRKKRPFMLDIEKKVNLDHVADFTLEKLGFNFVNVWYAFLFHNNYHEEDIENFFTPHVRLSNKKISFFESADEVSKRDIVQKLKKAANMHD